MDISSRLAALKVDLGITTTAYDDRLASYLNFAAEAITKEGITLDNSDVYDADLQIMYAAWLWNKRYSGEGMPRMIRWALNNRLFSEKTSGGGSE